MQNERDKRFYQKLKCDPAKWESRMEAQRKRRAQVGIRDAENKAERERWAALPKDHPRKTRKPKRNPENFKTQRRRYTERLPDSVVANRYLHMPVSECPPELIELKRHHIKLSRKLNTSIKTL